MRKRDAILTGAAGVMGAHLGHRFGGVNAGIAAGAVAAGLQHQQNKSAIQRPHPPAQNRIGPHSDMKHTGFKNVVGTKPNGRVGKKAHPFV